MKLAACSLSSALCAMPIALGMVSQEAEERNPAPEKKKKRPFLFPTKRWDDAGVEELVRAVTYEPMSGITDTDGSRAFEVLVSLLKKKDDVAEEEFQRKEAETIKKIAALEAKLLADFKDSDRGRHLIAMNRKLSGLMTKIFGIPLLGRGRQGWGEREARSGPSVNIAAGTEKAFPPARLPQQPVTHPPATEKFPAVAIKKPALPQRPRLDRHLLEFLNKIRAMERTVTDCAHWGPADILESIEGYLGYLDKLAEENKILLEKSAEARTALDRFRERVQEIVDGAKKKMGS